MAILLVDDEPMFTDAVERNLRRDGWEILTATSGDKALTILKDRSDVEILATDFNMTGMNGAQLINSALALEPNLYTIVFTGWADREYAVQSLRVGADDFLDKTGDIDEPLRSSILRGLAIVRASVKPAQIYDEAEVLEQVFGTLLTLNRFGGVCLASKKWGSDSCRVERAIDLNTGQNLSDHGPLEPDSAYRFVIDDQSSYFPPLFAPEAVDLKPYFDDTRSIIIVPLIFRSHEQGALGVEHREADKFDISTFRLVRQIARWISLTMDKLTDLDRLNLEKSRGERDRGLLARSLLHELKNPLNNLSTAVEVVMETIENEELNGLYENVLRINRTIDRFLKPLIQGGSDSELVNVAEVLGEAITRIKVYEPRSAVQIECEVASPVPPLMGNGEMLTAAFVNLLENAVRAAGPSGKVSVSAIYVPVRDQIEIMITDNGPGIASEDLAKVFDYGYTTRDEGHFGYGLALTHEIVQLFGGEITAHSPEGMGAMFKLAFSTSEE